MKSAFIGIDLGTTGCKAIVANSGFDILGKSYIEYDLIKSSPGIIEQDACVWWDLVKQTIKNAVKDAGIAPRSVKGMSISSQGIAFVPVDENCMPLRNAFSWLDTRAGAETEKLILDHGKDNIYKTTGKMASPAYTLPKILWLKKNEPELYEKTYRLLMPHDFIIAKLTGKYLTDRTMASGTMAYDIWNNEWWSDIFSLQGIDMDKMPEVRESGSAAGRILKSNVAELGIPEDTMVYVGGQDQKCAALGAGIDTGIMTVSLGTATAIEKVIDRQTGMKSKEMPVFSYLFDNKWITEGVISTSGASLKWVREQLFKDTTYEQMNDMMASNTRMEKDMFFYPFLGGECTPFKYDNAKGCFFGIGLDTISSDIMRSVLEGICFQIKANIEAMEKLDDKASELRVFGGGAESDVWCSMMSDITNRTVITLPTHETAGIGACMLAAIGSKEVSLADCRLKGSKRFEPDRVYAELCQNKYTRYIKMQEKIMK